MFRYTRLSAPSRPTESAPSLSTCGVFTASGAVKKPLSASGAPGYWLNCLLSRPPPASFSSPMRAAMPMRDAKS